MERIRTGIQGLDQLLSGGLPRGGTYALVGYSGTGKSILATQYVYNGAREYDEPGIYILIEEDKDRFMSNMGDFGWDFESLEKNGKLDVIPYSRSLMADIEAGFRGNMLCKDTSRAGKLREILTVDSLYRQISESASKIGAKRVVIDSMTIVTLMSADQVMGRMQTTWLIDKLRGMGLTTIITLEQGISWWNDIPFLCDGTIYMMLKEREGIFERGLLIEKMRGTDHDTGVRPIRIMSSEGIRVYPEELIMGSSKD